MPLSAANSAGVLPREPGRPPTSSRSRAPCPDLWYRSSLRSSCGFSPLPLPVPRLPLLGGRNGGRIRPSPAPLGNFGQFRPILQLTGLEGTFTPVECGETTLPGQPGDRLQTVRFGVPALITFANARPAAWFLARTTQIGTHPSPLRLGRAGEHRSRPQTDKRPGSLHDLS